MMKFLPLLLICLQLSFTACNQPSSNEKKTTPNTEATPKTDSAPAKETYACPMHPDVTSDQPGTCGKCGMDLEKK